MQTNNGKAKQKKVFWTKSNTTIVLLIIFLISAVLVPTTKHYLSNGEARGVLRTAKTIQLACRAIAYDYRTNEESLTDDKRRQGIKEEAEKSILELAGASGKIEYIAYDESSFQVEKLIYLENGYCAVYSNLKSEPEWSVYKIDKLLDF